MLSRTFFRLLAVVGLWAATNSAANAQYLFYSDSFNFSGSWSSYNTLADAQAGTNAVGSGTYASQPMVIFADGTTTNNQLGTAFYALPPNIPFLGVYDATNSTVTSNTSVFYNANDKSATITQSGSTNLGTSRFDPNGTLSNAASGGDWLKYSFSATAAGLNPFLDPNSPPPFAVNANPSSVSGTFSGIFQNTGGTGLFYDVNLTGSLGGARGLGQPINPTDSFLSSLVIPEPTSCLAFAMVFAASAGYGWRRRQLRPVDLTVSA